MYGKVDNPAPRPDPPLLRIKDFEAGRESKQWAALAFIFALSLVGGVWEGLAVAAGLLVITVGGVARRVEWRGRPLLPTSLGSSMAEKGWRGLSRDPLMLILIIVTVTVISLTLAVVVNTPATWIGSGIGAFVPLGALIALVLEIRRRGREREEA